MSQSRIFSRSSLLVVALLCRLSQLRRSRPAARRGDRQGRGTQGNQGSADGPHNHHGTCRKGRQSRTLLPWHQRAGALDLATKGEWGGKWFSGLGYSVETIENESYPFTQPYYWTFWVNHKSQEVGVCGIEMESGDEVLMFPECFSEKAGECPPNPMPLGVEAQTTANVGEEAPVTVKQYNAKGEASPAVGANIIGGGAGASTDSQGHATLKFFAAGTYTLRVSGAPTGPPAVRTETTICVHNGNDGTCGTTVPGTTIVNGGPEIVHVAPANTATVGGVKNGHHYARGKGPRILRGLVQVPAGGTLRDVHISLQRQAGKRCFAFSGITETFVRDHCGATRFFSVGGSESFSYLLPASLPKGRYVYDIEAINDGGNATKLVPGVSHVVFYVK